ncbi:MAG: HSP20 family molecular chaperone IbpA [Marinoscillum sp.]|jgi:HSP20 family molecular chaperone IbpA
MKAADRVLIKNLAHTAEIINTINGGMSEPYIGIDKSPEQWTVNVKVPGMNPDRLRIEVRNLELSLFHMISEGNSSDIELPYLLASIQLTSSVDIDNILAEYERGQLSIHLPLDESTDGFEREVEIIKR